MDSVKASQLRRMCVLVGGLISKREITWSPFNVLFSYFFCFVLCVFYLFCFLCFFFLLWLYFVIEFSSYLIDQFLCLSSSHSN